MAEYLLTLSALILVILIIRWAFRKTISPTVMYALWLVVVIRLCLPFSLFTLAVLPSEPDTPVFESEAEQTPEDTTSVTDAPETHPDLPGIPVIPGTTMVPVIPPVPVTPSGPVIPIDPITPIEPTPDTNPAAPIEPDVPDVPSAVPFNLKKLAVTVWIAGACILAVWFAVTGCIYHLRLRGKRTLYKKVNHTRVYLTDDKSAPCLAGLIPSIYIRPETPKAGDAHAFIVLHEYMHLRHGDHIWSVVRILALIAHWWNPLVWTAAIVSKQDAELACDHAVAAKLKSEDRFAYARILLDTVPQKHRYAVGLGSSPMKERIMALTKKQKNRILCVVLAAAIAAGAVGCSFIALTEKPQSGEDDAGKTDGGGEVEKSSLGDYVKLDVAPSGGMEVEDMPLTQYARLTAYPVGYIPMVYVYDDDMTFYMVYSAPGKITRYKSVLRLPDGYENGYIAYAEGGAGSGELFLYVTAETNGEDVLLAYYFLCDGSQPQPTEVIILTGEWETRIRENLTTRPTDAEIRELWRSIDGQRNPYGLTYGMIPNSFSPLAGTFTSADTYADGGARLNEVLNAYNKDVHQMPVLAYVVREMEVSREELIAYLEKSEIPYTESIVKALMDTDLVSLNKMFLNPMAEYHDGVIYTTEVLFEMEKAGQEIPLSLQIVRRIAQNAKEYGDRSATPLPEEYADMYTRVLTKKLGEITDLSGWVDSYIPEYFAYPRTLTLLVGEERFEKWLDETPLFTLDGNYNIIPRSILTLLADLGVLKEDFKNLSYIEYYSYIYDVERMYGSAEAAELFFTNISEWEKRTAERLDLVRMKGLLLDAMPGYTNDIALRDKYNSLPLTCWTFSDLLIDGIYTKEEMADMLEHSILFDSVGMQTTNRYDIDAIAAVTERSPAVNIGHVSPNEESTREELLLYGSYCKSVIEKERTFYTPWYDLPRYEEDKGAVSVDSAGPFVGYVADAYTPWIELYTEVDGLYVGRIPYKIFDGWPATGRSRESWRPGWQPEYMHFYFDRIGNFVWAGVHLTDTVAGSGRKNIATSADGGTTWEICPYYETDFGGNHVTGMGFASENVAFMSFDPQFEPVGTVAISRTTDGGKTWERMPIEVPEIISANRLTPLVPRFDGLTGDYPILLSVAKDGQKYENTVYLRTQDGGMTWEWDIERALSTYRLPGKGTWEAHYTPAAMYDYDVGEMAANCYYDPHVGYYVTELYATSNKSYVIVLGVQNDRQPYGTFTDFKTYRVVRKANYVDSVTELPTITKEIVYREGEPFTGTLEGVYQSKLYGEQGLMNRRVVIEGDTISVHVGLDATDAGGLYEGTYTHDKTTGTFTATVKASGAINSDLVTVSGKLYEYGGYVHFLCEASEVYSISADGILPLTFRKEGAPLPDNSDMIGEGQAGDWYSTYTDDYGKLQYVYRLTFEPETHGITFSSDYTNGEYGHVYEGTYTIDANYFVRATLREGTEEITMKFSFGYSQTAAPSGGWIKTLGITLYECSAERYKDLIGMRLIFEEDLILPKASSDPVSQAKVLTDHLIRLVMTKDWLNLPFNYTDKDIFSFLSTLCLYRDNADHPYGSMTTVDEQNTRLKLSLADAQTIAAELFGRNDWSVDSFAADDIYDAQKQSYFVPIGIGFSGSPFSYKDMTVSVQGEYVHVTLTLMNSASYEAGVKIYGTYAFVYRYSGGYLTLMEIRAADEGGGSASASEKWEMYPPAFAKNAFIQYSKIAAYGENILYADTMIYPYQTGVGYVTFGVISDTPGQFSRYCTYRVTSVDGYITSAEETETFTVENVLKNGTPYKGSLDGEYRCEAYNGDMLLYRYIKISGNAISVSVSRSGTDGGGTYTGTYSYDENTGSFTADVRLNGTGDPHSVTGRLYEYGGFVHFLCRSSTIGTISPDDPLPLTFVKPTAPKYESYDLQFVG